MYSYFIAKILLLLGIKFFFLFNSLIFRYRVSHSLAYLTVAFLLVSPCSGDLYRRFLPKHWRPLVFTCRSLCINKHLTQFYMPIEALQIFVNSVETLTAKSVKSFTRCVLNTKLKKNLMFHLTAKESLHFFK